MNSKLPYEKQIAGKLAELPLPDLEDAIWASIESGLDADFAMEESAVREKMTTEKIRINKSFYKNGIISFIVFVAVVVSIIIVKETKHKKQPQKDKIFVPVPSNVEKPPENKKEAVSDRIPLHKNDTLIDFKNEKLKVDSVITIQPEPKSTILIPLIDSVVKVNQPVKSLPRPDSILKKPKGVLGISDTDYRFQLERKDSLKN